MNKKKKFPLLLLLGFFLSLGVMISYFVYFIFDENMRNQPLILMIANFLIAFVTIWIAIKSWRNKENTLFYRAMGISIAFLALLPPALLVLVSYMAHDIPDKKEAMQNNVAAPSFSLNNSTGEIVKLSDYKGKNFVLVFYRGYW